MKERKERILFISIISFLFVVVVVVKKKSGFVLEARSFDFVWLFYTQLAGAGRRSTACRLVICFFFSVLQGKGGKTSIKKMNDMFDAIDGQKEKNPDRRTKDKKKRAQAKKRRIMATTDETHSKLMIHYTA